MKKLFKARRANDLGSVLTALALAFMLLHTCAVAQPPSLLDDLDANARPTVFDLQRLLNHINGTQLLTRLLPYADLNEDGLINTTDVLLLQDAILGRSVLPNPHAAPVVNAPVVATNGSAITITGLARPHRRILIIGGRFAVFVNADGNGFFTTVVQLRPNQINASTSLATLGLGPESLGILW